MTPEDQIHRDVVKHIRARQVPGTVWWHTPNDGKRSYKTANRLKQMGVRAGVSDLVFFRDGELFALELKAPGNTPTENQLKFMDDVRQAGGHAVCAEGAQEAIACLVAWGCIREAA